MLPRECAGTSPPPALLYRAVLVALVPLLVVVGNAQCPCNSTVTWSALQDLYASTSGPRWTRRDRWLEAGSSVCDWYGVQCTSLRLDGNNLVGTLPPSLGNVTTWNIVVMAHNRITGTLPPEYSSWTSVQNFTVSNCSIGGTLPPQWSAWPQIQWFYTSQNNLTGTLPPEYSAWTSLKYLYLGSNQLTGTLPAAYRSWSLIDHLVVQNNFLSGSLPPEYSAWGSSFTRLEVSNNNLTGTLPPEYGDFTNLLHFYAENNKLSGSLPPSYANWKEAVRSVTLQHNQLSGTLPPEYQAWTELLHFFVGGNQLTGTLPVEYQAWTDIVSFGCYLNQISGTLPPEYSAWTRVSIFLMSSNLLEGTLPPSYRAWTHFTSVAVDDNRLSGTLPREWTGTFMGAVALHNNWGLHGTIPSSMSTPVAVSLCNTSICGSLPSAWGPTFLFCQVFSDAVMEALERFDVSVLTPVAKRIPPCTAAPPATTQPSTTAAPSPSSVSAATAALDPVLRAGSGVTTSVFAWSATFAALSPSPGGYSLGPALHISSSAARIAVKLLPCVGSAAALSGDGGAPSSPPEANDNDDAVGSFAGDNPTTIRLPGRLSLAGGTVVGNTALLYGAPPVLAALVTGFRYLRKAPHSQRESFSVTNEMLLLLSVRAHVAIFGFLVIPTVAASAVLLLDGGQGGGGVAPAALGVVGLLVTSASAALGAAAWRRHRPLSGARAPVRKRAASRQRRSPEGWWCSRLAGVMRVLLAKRGTWEPAAAARVSSRRAGARERLVGALLLAFLQESVLAAVYPHAYAFAVDFLVAVFQGLILGVAASPLTVSCGAVRALLWTTVAASAAATAYEAVVRPRATLLDQAVVIVMSVGATITSVLAAVGNADAAAAMATAQAVLSLVLVMVQTIGSLALPTNTAQGSPNRSSLPPKPPASTTMGASGAWLPPSRAARALLRNLLNDSREDHTSSSSGSSTKRQHPFCAAAAATAVDAISAQRIAPRDVLEGLLWVICRNTRAAAAPGSASSPRQSRESACARGSFAVDSA